MSNIHYPPIPGRAGKRGRPSREEMDERRKYWETHGGVPSSTPEANETSDTHEALSQLINHLSKSSSSSKQTAASSKAPSIVTCSEAGAGRPDFVGDRPMTKRAQPIMQASKPVVINMDNLPEDIQDIVKSCPVPFNREDKKFIDELVKTLPPSKRGRPSREDIQAKQQIVQKINNLIVEKIRSAQQSGQQLVIPNKAPVSIETKVETATFADVAPLLIPVGTIFDFPQFKDGDRVRMKNSKDKFTLTKKGRKKREKRSMGIVTRHDIGSSFAFVRWNGGTQEWVNARGLATFAATKEDIEEILDEDDDE